MVQYKSLFVALATVSTVAASPCKAIASSVLSTTVVSEGVTSTTVTETSAADTSVAETTATSAAESTTTYVEYPTTTSLPDAATTTVDETTITTAFTTTNDLTTTSTAAEATTSAAVPVCGVTGYFVSGQPAMTYLTSPGNEASAKECLEGCATWAGCELIAFYETGSSMGTCEYFHGKILTEGSVTVYKWYDLGCLASM